MVLGTCLFLVVLSVLKMFLKLTSQLIYLIYLISPPYRWFMRLNVQLSSNKLFRRRRLWRSICPLIMESIHGWCCWFTSWFLALTHALKQYSREHCFNKTGIHLLDIANTYIASYWATHIVLSIFLTHLFLRITIGLGIKPLWWRNQDLGITWGPKARK